MKVSFHAIERFREHTGCKKPKEKVISKILEMAESAKEVQVAGLPTEVEHNDRLRECKYLHYNGWIIIAVCDLIKTLYMNTEHKLVIEV